MATYLCICTKTREEAVIETVARPEVEGCDGYLFGRVVGNHPMKGQLFAKPNSRQAKTWQFMGWEEFPLPIEDLIALKVENTFLKTWFLLEYERPRPQKSVTLFHARLAEAYEEMKRKEVA